jgi:hypothetical protein
MSTRSIIIIIIIIIIPGECSGYRDDRLQVPFKKSRIAACCCCIIETIAKQRTSLKLGITFS